MSILNIFYPIEQYWSLGQQDWWMQRTILWLNWYGCKAVLYKAQNSQKNAFFVFFPVLGLMLDSLTTILVELHWCPLLQSILLTQGLIPLNFAKKYWELTIFFIAWGLWPTLMHRTHTDRISWFGFHSTILTPTGPPGVSREAKSFTNFEFGTLVR